MFVKGGDVHISFWFVFLLSSGWFLVLAIWQEPAHFDVQAKLGLNVDHWLAAVSPLDALPLWYARPDARLASFD